MQRGIVHFLCNSIAVEAADRVSINIIRQHRTAYVVYSVLLFVISRQVPELNVLYARLPTDPSDLIRNLKVPRAHQAHADCEIIIISNQCFLRPSLVSSTLSDLYICACSRPVSRRMHHMHDKPSRPRSAFICIKAPRDDAGTRATFSSSL